MGLIGSIIGAVVGGGGPSSAMMSDANKASAFATELLGDYSTMFNFTESMLNDLKSNYSSVAALGPSQHGYSSSVLNQLNTQLLNSSAASYRNSSQAVRSFMAGQGGGAASGVTSGIAAQIEGDMASKALSDVTAGQTKIMLNDIALGNENWRTAMSGLNTVAGLGSKMTGDTGSLAGSALKESFGMQKEIHKEKEAAENAKWGAIAGLGDAALGAVTGGLSAMGSGESFGEGFKDFMSGAFLGGSGSPGGGGSGAPVGSGSDGDWGQ